MGTNRNWNRESDPIRQAEPEPKGKGGNVVAKSRKPKVRSSHAINRKKQDEKIAKENAKFLMRLKGAQPTLNKKKLATDYSKNRKIAQNIRQVKARPRRTRPEWVE